MLYKKKIILALIEAINSKYNYLYKYGLFSKKDEGRNFRWGALCSIAAEGLSLRLLYREHSTHTRDHSGSTGGRLVYLDQVSACLYREF